MGAVIDISEKVGHEKIKGMQGKVRQDKKESPTDVQMLFGPSSWVRLDPGSSGEPADGQSVLRRRGERS